MELVSYSISLLQLSYQHLNLSLTSTSPNSQNQFLQLQADISANLKSKVSKIQAQKSLAVLHEKGEILGKVYGKTTVYCALQVS